MFFYHKKDNNKQSKYNTKADLLQIFFKGTAKKINLLIHLLLEVSGS